MFEFKIPEVGENIKSGNVVKIAVKAGDAVKKGQTLLELETDKATIEVPSPANGIIKEIMIKEGQDVNIGQVVMKIQEGAVSKAALIPKPAATPEVKKQTKAPEPVQTVQTSSPVVAQPMVSVSSSGKDVPAAPSVRRFAREIGIDVTQVSGTGPGGRISVDDVKAYAKA